MPAPVMHFYSGSPMHFLSGVDRGAVKTTPIGNGRNPPDHVVREGDHGCQLRARRRLFVELLGTGPGRRPKRPGTRCNPRTERLENVLRKAEPGGRPMFFTFPEDARWNVESRPWSSGSRSENTAAWSGSRGACSSACCRIGQPRNGASKPITYSEHGSSGSPSASYVAGN